MARALTGIQPSGQIHLGNYLGSLRPALELQRAFQAFYFVADYHALTTLRDPAVLRESSLEVAATFLALGLDSEAHVLFRQSDVPEVCELAWVLSCSVSSGMLDRGHAVKAARDDGRDVNAGTLFYPLLMSADILLYDSEIVPVGQDQKQHVEIARDIAQSVNYRFGDGTLAVPEVLVKEGVGTVLGLDGRKMSKSYGNTIPLWAPPKALRKNIMRIVTDSKGVDEPKDPDTCTVFGLYKAFATAEQTEQLATRYRSGGMGYGHAKQELFELIDAQLAEPRARYAELRADPTGIDAVLERGAALARAAAQRTMTRVRARVGLR